MPANAMVCTKMPAMRIARVVDARRSRDGAAEHEAEEHHEHDRAERHVEQELRRALDVDEVAPDHLAASRDSHAAKPSRCHLLDGASSAGRPVIDRKTSSSVGRRKPMSSTWTPAASSVADGARQDAVVSSDGHADVPRLLVDAGDAARRGASRTRRPASSHGASLMRTSSRSPPVWRFSSSAVPRAIDPAVVDDGDVIGEDDRPPRGTASS